AHPRRPPSALYRQRTRPRAAGQLERGAQALRQSHANRLPPCASRAEGREAGRRGSRGEFRGPQMGKATGFLAFETAERAYEKPEARKKTYAEFLKRMDNAEIRTQAARCMNCGIPFCQGTGSVAPGTPGCPVNNQIPDFNDLVYRNHWKRALDNLHSTNNFP